MSQTPSQISPQHQTDIVRVVDYWFTPSPPATDVKEKWFRPSNPRQIDDEIHEKFESLIEQARNDELDSWTSTPMGSLALIILLDQFPRNIYRGSHLSYATDAKAVEVAVASVAKEFHQSPELTELQTMFLFMPFEHSESLAHQIACITLFENLRSRCLGNSQAYSNQVELEEAAEFLRGTMNYAKSHRDVIMMFGRFPSRNVAMGRESTPEEVAFLKENPGGFAMKG